MVEDVGREESTTGCTPTGIIGGFPSSVFGFPTRATVVRGKGLSWVLRANGFEGPTRCLEHVNRPRVSSSRKGTGWRKSRVQGSEPDLDRREGVLGSWRAKEVSV